MIFVVQPKKNRSRGSSSKSYEQYCGVARALDVLGERWTLLVVRDLLMGPKRYTDLRDGLPGIATDLLTARLRTLETAGLVRRRQLPKPAPATVYELTAKGFSLSPAVLALGQLGLTMLGAPEPSENIRPERIALLLRLSFHPAVAADLDATYQLIIDDEPFAINVANAAVDTAPGTTANPTLSLTTDAGTMIAMLRREISPTDALAGDRVQLDGAPAVLEHLIDVFAYPTGVAEATGVAAPDRLIAR
jgi:DNA-binding HxlR family transcriptional regulator